MHTISLQTQLALRNGIRRGGWDGGLGTLSEFGVDLHGVLQTCNIQHAAAN